MRKLVVFIVFLSFALRPLYFVGNVLYYQLNIDYIIETYCVNVDKPMLKCNGKCHLAKTLNVSDLDGADSQESFNLISESFYPLYFHQPQKEITNQRFYSYTFKYWVYKDVNPFQLSYNSFEPPRFHI